MTEAASHGLPLLGSTPLSLDGLHTGSLGNYLASLGLLSVATRMGDGITIRGCWKDGRFLLYSNAPTFNREALCKLVQNWKPTPFERWWKETQEASKKDGNALPKLRASESDEHIDQLDAVMVQADRRVFNDLFGTGGNIGKRNLTAVWKRCNELREKPEASSWLEHSLFGTNNVSLPKLNSAGTWFVFSNKMFNSGQNWYREGRLSPWSFLLAMEGALLLRGGVHRQLGAQAKGRAVFPFMCRPTAPATDKQVGHGKCEFWAPLWSKLATLPEIEALFRTGLVEVGSRLASAPHEFAIAALDAAVDAGVAAFIRFDLRKTTSDKVFEALPREQVHVHHDRSGLRHSRLLLPLITKRWVDRLPYEPTDSKQRGKFVGLRGPVEDGIVSLSDDPADPEKWRDLLLLLARTQERIDHNKALRVQCNPLPLLHPGWFDKAWSEPPVELQVARAVASIGSTSLTIQRQVAQRSMMFNIFGVERKETGALFFPEAHPTRTVWHKGQPVQVLIDLLRRRLADADELDPVPLHGTCPCNLDMIACFLSEDGCDDELLVSWIPPLALLDWKSTAPRNGNGNYQLGLPLHPLYSLFRPLIDSEGLTIGDKPLFPLRNDDSRKPHTAAVRTLVNLVLQGQVDQAVDLARRRYLGAGWQTFKPPLQEMYIDCERLAAALLVPVRPTELAVRFAHDWLIKTNRR